MKEDATGNHIPNTTCNDTRSEYVPGYYNDSEYVPGYFKEDGLEHDAALDDPLDEYDSDATIGYRYFIELELACYVSYSAFKSYHKCILS